MASPTSPSARSPIYSVPKEIIGAIASYLPNRDIKSLRLSASFLHDSVFLRLHRLFISPSPRNIAVLRAVADNEKFRHSITEIIWDDATLRVPDGFRAEDFEYAILPESVRPGCPEWYGDGGPGCPEWFRRECKEMVRIFEIRKKRDIDRPDHDARQAQLNNMIHPSRAWALYDTLLKEQNDVLASNADEEALKYALQRFPRLRKITITPATHGVLFLPLYETPMIRSFPYGFIYPIPRGWPAGNIEHFEPDKPFEWEDATEQQKEAWHGYRVVTRVLAQEMHQVSSFTTAVHGLPTGINCHIFDQSCDEFDNFVAMAKKPGLQHLDLALHVGTPDPRDLVPLRRGLLKRALGNATGLKYFNLSTDVRDDSCSLPEDHVPLRSMLPLEAWTQLQHCGIRGLEVTEEDLISFLAELPPTVRSIELSFLRFIPRGESYYTFLIRLRDGLNWRDRAPAERPKVCIATRPHQGLIGRYFVIDGDVDKFLYEYGPNPFCQGLKGMVRGVDGQWTPYDGVGRGDLLLGYGIQKDEFDPGFDRPNLNTRQLADLGIIRWRSRMTQG